MIARSRTGSPQDKIRELEELAQILASLRAENKKIVHCHGVFDLLHIGHIRYFEQARRLGDILVVTVTPDRYVDKGPHRPALFIEFSRRNSAISQPFSTALSLSGSISCA